MVHDGRTVYDHVVEDIHTSPVSLELDELLQICSLSLSVVIPPVNGASNVTLYVYRSSITLHVRHVHTEVHIYTRAYTYGTYTYTHTHVDTCTQLYTSYKIFCEHILVIIILYLIEDFH